jgi:hypothetical protein
VESGCGVLRELRIVVRFAEEGRGPFEEFEKLGKAPQVITGGEFVIFKRYGVFLGQGFDAVGPEHAFEMQVEFGFWQVAKKVFDLGVGKHLASLAGGSRRECHRSYRATKKEELMGFTVCGKAAVGRARSKLQGAPGESAVEKGPH